MAISASMALLASIWLASTTALADPVSTVNYLIWFDLIFLFFFLFLYYLLFRHCLVCLCDAIYFFFSPSDLWTSFLLLLLLFFNMLKMKRKRDVNFFGGGGELVLTSESVPLDWQFSVKRWQQFFSSFLLRMKFEFWLVLQVNGARSTLTSARVNRALTEASAST